MLSKRKCPTRHATGEGVPMTRSRCARAARWVAALAFAGMALAGPASAESIRIGLLKYGTVNWEIDVIKANGFDKAHGIELDVRELAGRDASTIALQAGDVDVIVADWLWVGIQRSEGADYTFMPYSKTVGSVMVPADSTIKTVADLKGKRLGIAGGPLDKSWLLLRGLAEQEAGIDLDSSVEKVFGAPPLLNEQMLAGRLDAVLNFWHFAARLEAAGMRPAIGIEGVLDTLGVKAEVPLLGYIFDAKWAAAHKDAVLGFAAASRDAKKLLGESDAEWDRIRPLTRAEDDKTFVALRDNYRRGIPTRWGEAERDAARKTFAILAKLGGEKLVGKAETLPEGTFWPDLTY